MHVYICIYMKIWEVSTVLVDVLSTAWESEFSLLFFTVGVNNGWLWDISLEHNHQYDFIQPLNKQTASGELKSSNRVLNWCFPDRFNRTSRLQTDFLKYNHSSASQNLLLLDQFGGKLANICRITTMFYCSLKVRVRWSVQRVRVDASVKKKKVLQANSKPQSAKRKSKKQGSIPAQINNGSNTVTRCVKALGKLSQLD